MKKAFWILGFVFSGLLSQAQNSWKFKLDNKLVFAALAENDAANIKKISKSKFKATSKFDILYKELKPQADWKRSFLFFDENDNELLRKESAGAMTRISGKELQDLIKDKKQVKIYTIYLPTDPNKAAAIRVRRVHLCTLDLQ